MNVEEEFDLEIRDSDVEHILTFGNALDYLIEKL